MGNYTYAFNVNERNDLSDFNCHWWYGKEVNRHSHDDYYEIIIVTEGTINHTVNEYPYTQKIGDVIILAPNTVHSINSLNDEFAKHYNIAIKKDHFSAFLGNKEVLKYELNTSGAYYIELKEVTYKYIYDLILKIDNERYDALGYTLVETVIYSIISEILLNIRSTSDKENRVAYLCKDAIRRINNYSLITKKATEIYEMYPVSHTAFVKEFKKITGKTLVSYLAEKKLAYARNLLLTTDYSILEISAMLEYDSLSHFIRIFKSNYGETPYKYRKNNIGKPIYTDPLEV